MLRTIEGVYREGKVELAEQPNDVGEEVPVLVTFLEPHRVDLRTHGIGEAHSAELRARLSAFAEDWVGAEMDVYDDYDTARARLQAGPARKPPSSCSSARSNSSEKFLAPQVSRAIPALPLSSC